MRFYYLPSHLLAMKKKKICYYDPYENDYYSVASDIPFEVDFSGKAITLQILHTTT
jgi:hypothetical protein